MYRVALVSYLNTTPFRHGIAQSGILPEGRFHFEAYYPSACAAALLEGRADIGLVPVAVLKQMPEYYIVGDTCIGTEGLVRSVVLVSEVPVEQIERVYLDYQSRTSVALTRILMQQFWHRDVEFLAAPENYLDSVSGTTAAVVIGDRALDEVYHRPYVYDLAEAWKSLTGLPFVFALWVSRSPIPENDIALLNQAFHWGIDHVLEVIPELSKHYPEHYRLEAYLTQNISYIFDAPKKQALETFLAAISNS